MSDTQELDVSASHGSIFVRVHNLATFPDCTPGKFAPPRTTGIHYYIVMMTVRSRAAAPVQVVLHAPRETLRGARARRDYFSPVSGEHGTEFL